MIWMITEEKIDRITLIAKLRKQAEDGRSPILGHLHVEDRLLLDAANQIESDGTDTQRLDWIEQCIRDGSYPSILNDIIAVCQAAYIGFGPGPALRTAIDGCMMQAKE